MKTAFPVLFLIIFLGCKNESSKNINQALLYTQTGAEQYPLDSALFEVPCSNEATAAISYRGTICYTIKDMEAAEKKMAQIVETVHAGNPKTRNEHIQNGVLHKRYEYTVPTDSFLGIEKKLDSLLGRPVTKDITKNEISGEYLLENLKEEQQIYKIYVARYNNTGTPFQEKNDLLPLIKSSAHSIKATQQSLCHWKNESILTIQLSIKL